MKNHIFTFITLIFISLPSVAESSISFTDGKWETNFACSEQSQSSPFACDGLTPAGSWWASRVTAIEIVNGGSGYVAGNVVTIHGSQGRDCDITVNSVDSSGTITTVTLTYPGTNFVLNTTYTVSGGAGAGATIRVTGLETKFDQITAGANNSTASAGLGFRHWIADGWNSNGGGIGADFPSAQKELWIRAYIRFESGFSWANGQPHYDKLFYVHTAASGYDAIAGFQPSGSGKAGVIGQTSGGTPFMPTKGWRDIYPTSVSDGSWYAFEMYIKMDDVVAGVSQNNGVARTWLNGELMGSNTSFNWSGGNATAAAGWVNMLIGSNQDAPANMNILAVDYDDIVIYNTTPPNVDANGNRFIGLATGLATSTKKPACTNGKISLFGGKVATFQ